jgi:mono/diheme cytochrome c family protein
MVSIPALATDTSMDLNAVPDPTTGELPANANYLSEPYTEIKPGDPQFDTAKQVAVARLASYHAGRRYTYCPDTSDILDPLITEAVNSGLTVPTTNGPIADPTDPTGNTIWIPDMGIPLRPHWVVTDDTDVPGPWSPRRADWAQALLQFQNVGSGVDPDDIEQVTNVIVALKSVKLSDDVRTALLTEAPFGLWVPENDCNFTNVPTVADLQTNPATEPDWLKILNTQPTPPKQSTPVYTLSPGEAIFSTICFNCHGTQADSKGLVADEVTLLTGGDARVANLRDGLLGPLTSPGANRAAVFQDGATALANGVTADDVGARYLAWMALGGTTKHLPLAVLNQVSKTHVLGAGRGPNLSQTGSPDMLRLGLELCLQLAASDDRRVTAIDVQSLVTGQTHYIDWTQQSQQPGLIGSNGDAEMWMRLCSLDNRPIVRKIVKNATGTVAEGYFLYWGDNYPSNAPVMDHHGNIVNGITSDNLFPMCSGDASIAGVPPCPAQVVAPSNQLSVVPNGPFSDFVDAKAWAARGAINGALAVFLYLDQVERGKLQPQAPYNQCEKRGTTGYR